MLERTIYPLGELARFNGAGIYAIYYTGSFPAYAPLAQYNSDGRYAMPIYVGKAVSPGARRGNFGLESTPGPALYSRLVEHGESVALAENLDIYDFACRFLV